MSYGPDAANVLYHVVNARHLRRRAMVFTTNKSLRSWGKVLHDQDLADAIVERILERGRLITLDGPSMRTRHLELGDIEPEDELQPAIIPESTGQNFRNPQGRNRIGRTRFVPRIAPPSFFPSSAMARRVPGKARAVDRRLDPG